MSQYNYYTKAQVNSLIASSGGSSGGGTSNTLTTAGGVADLDTKASYTARQLASTFPFNHQGSWPNNLLLFRGTVPTTSSYVGKFVGATYSSGTLQNTVAIYLWHSSNTCNDDVHVEESTRSPGAIDSTYFTVCYIK